MHDTAEIATDTPPMALPAVADLVEPERLAELLEAPAPARSPGGRPTRRCPETVAAALAVAFSLGATVSGACAHAGIGRSTLYAWDVADPGFPDRLKALGAPQVLRALQTVSAHLDDPRMARWYLERRHPDFRRSGAVRHSGSVGAGAVTHIESGYVSPGAARVLERPAVGGGG